MMETVFTKDMEATTTKFEATGHGWKSQKPFTNGITVWRHTGWAGNGFGNAGDYVAVTPDGMIVGEFHTGSASGLDWVSADGIRGNGFFTARRTYAWSGGRRYVSADSVSPLTQWKNAVRDLKVAQ